MLLVLLVLPLLPPLSSSRWSRYCCRHVLLLLLWLLLLTLSILYEIIKRKWGIKWLFFVYAPVLFETRQINRMNDIEDECKENNRIRKWLRRITTYSTSGSRPLFWYYIFVFMNTNDGVLFVRGLPCLALVCFLFFDTTWHGRLLTSVEGEDDCVTTTQEPQRKKRLCHPLWQQNEHPSIVDKSHGRTYVCKVQVRTSTYSTHFSFLSQESGC